MLIVSNQQNSIYLSAVCAIHGGGTFHTCQDIVDGVMHPLVYSLITI